MTIEIHSCAGGVVEVPDLRGGRDCYGDDYDSMVITQTPPPGEEVGAGQTIINVLTEDGNGNATICTHYLNVTADNPAPTLLCPEPITAWLVTGGYEVPDLTTEVEIVGGCTVYDDLVITQSPAAGALITTAGVHTITVTVEDEFGHEVVCGETTVTLRDPSPVNPVVVPPDPPITTPSYIFTANLFAYWPLDDFGFLVDRSVYVLGGSGTGRDLSNSGGAVQQPSHTVLESCHPVSPGPIFGSGSAYLNRSNSAVLTRADDANLRMTGTSWTLRFGLRLVAQDQFGADAAIISKKNPSLFTGGWRLMLTRFGGANNYIYPQLYDTFNNPITTAPVPVSLNTWMLIVMTFDNSNGVLSMYADGALSDSSSSPGFVLGSDSSAFAIGSSTSGTRIEAYVDEVGMWTTAWDAGRVANDFEIVRCL